MYYAYFIPLTLSLLWLVYDFVTNKPTPARELFLLVCIAVTPILNISLLVNEVRINIPSSLVINNKDKQ